MVKNDKMSNIGMMSINKIMFNNTKWGQFNDSICF